MGFNDNQQDRDYLSKRNVSNKISIEETNKSNYSILLTKSMTLTKYIDKKDFLNVLDFLIKHKNKYLCFERNVNKNEWNEFRV